MGFGGLLNNKYKITIDSGVYDVECFRCGTCCSKYQPRLNLTEARVLADKLQTKWQDFVQEYTDPRWPGIKSFLIKHRSGACIFLHSSSSGKQNLCKIHLFKPSCCREWKTGLERPECLRGLSATWGLTVDSEGNICGVPEKLALFSSYLNKNKDGE